MRESRSYEIGELRSQTALSHAHRYLSQISGKNISLDEDDLEDSMRETPETVLQSDVLNSAESYFITYRRTDPGPEIGVEIVDVYDIGDEIVVSGEGRYLENVEQIMESGNPSRKSSTEAFDHRVREGLKNVKAQLGG